MWPTCNGLAGGYFCGLFIYDSRALCFHRPAHDDLLNFEPAEQEGTNDHETFRLQNVWSNKPAPFWMALGIIGVSWHWSSSGLGNGMTLGGWDSWRCTNARVHSGLGYGSRNAFLLPQDMCGGRSRIRTRSHLPSLARQTISQQHFGLWAHHTPPLRHRCLRRGRALRRDENYTPA